MPKKPPLLQEIDWTSLKILVVDGVDKIVENGRPPKDFDHHVFEAVLEAMYGPTVWKWYDEAVEDDQA